MTKQNIAQQYSSTAIQRWWPLIIKRGETRVLELEFTNTGDATWYDIRNKKKLPAGHQPVILQSSEDSSELEIKMGESLEKTDRSFHGVYAGRLRRKVMPDGIAEPGSTVAVRARITPRKFSARGRHKVQFYLGFRDDFTTTESFEKITVSVWVWHFSWENFTRDIKRQLKLLLSKPGSVSYITQNKVSSHEEAMPVVMCTWKRLENLQHTIDLLKRQSHPVNFYIWNNNEAIRKDIDEIVMKERHLPIQVFHSKHNIGGYGRYYLARTLSETTSYVIFIDDDQTFDEAMVEDFTKEAQPKSIYSQWAFRFTDVNNYWHKRGVAEGEQAHYLGTGGMVLDRAIFEVRELFSCPYRYWFAEDLWLSYVSDKEGWKLLQSSVKFDMREDGKDQTNHLVDKKNRMLRCLVRSKRWSV